MPAVPMYPCTVQPFTPVPPSRSSRLHVYPLRRAAHPHDAIFLNNGDIAVALWKGHEPGSFGGIEYWKLLTTAEQ